ncbi:MAG: hypothetical protein KatS3mg060_3149 [Dehalococcoidia bacterium]|nr:MAG: hypothetical protein KatS3mg060_3149 [Dehalococcoidia bacterium]
MAHPPDPFPIADGLQQRLAEDNGHVFDRVMLVDMQVARGMDGEVESAVACEVCQHMIEKADARRDIGPTAAVEVEPDVDGGLGGDAPALGKAAFDTMFDRHASTSSGRTAASAAASWSVSSGRPTLTRIAFSSSGVS